MEKQATGNAPNYKVTCSWCGVVFERARAKDRHGMCHKCFARMWEECSRAYTESGVPRWASER